MSKYFDNVMKKAISGDAEAQFKLASLYYRGRGIKKDHEKTAEWFRKAAEQGHARAQYELAKCYVCGVGVENDGKAAFFWYNKAAEQELADAEKKIGDSYTWGSSVEKDYEKALRWYLMAASHGNISAVVLLELHYGIKPPDGIDSLPEYRLCKFTAEASFEATRRQDRGVHAIELPESPDCKGRTIMNSNIMISLRGEKDVL